MKNYFKAIQSTFNISQEEKEIYTSEIVDENFKRGLILLSLALPVTILHISMFFKNLENSKGIEHNWVCLIIEIHLTVLILSITGLLLYFLKLKKSTSIKVKEVFSHFTLMVLLLASISLALVDQLVTNAIYPFLFCTIIIGVVFYIKPKLALFYFSITYVIFYLLLPYTQSNSDIILSNRANGLTYSMVGFALSAVFWKANLTRKSLARLIFKQNEELILQHKEKDKLFSIISHDLRGPISGFLSLTEILYEEAEQKKDEELKTMMHSVTKSASNVFNLLENLLEWSRLRQNLITYTPVSFNLEKYINETLKAIEVSASKKSIQIQVNIPKELELYSDPLMVQTIIRNLCSNAIKFTPNNGSILLEAQKLDDRQVIISVRDTGIGMTKEMCEHLFSIGTKTNRLGTNGEKSTGLGLVICKELAEKLGGEILVESEEKIGTTFYLKLKHIK